MTEQLTIFISHASEESYLAKRLETELLEWFPHCNVFNSSERSIKPGDDWFQKVLNNLKSCHIFLAIVTPLSIKRPWINFEMGAAWILMVGNYNPEEKLIIPCCANGLRVAELKPPMNTLQAIDLAIEPDVQELMDRIANHSLRPHRPIDTNPMRLNDFVQDIEGFESTISVSYQGSEEPTRIAHDTTGDHLQPNGASHNWETEVQKLLLEIIDVPYEALSDSPTERYSKRYMYGERLAELASLDDNLLNLVHVRGQYEFQAMKYLVTRRLFQKYTHTELNWQLREMYFPYTLPESGFVDERQFKMWWDQNIRPFIEGVAAEPRFAGKDVRLPTKTEWLQLAEPIDSWDWKRVSKCNVARNVAENRRISAVGVFSDSRSKHGCFDVIGNVWELCVNNPGDRYPSSIAGWSFRDEYNARSQEDWWQTFFNYLDAIGYYIGFRLIISESSC